MSSRSYHYRPASRLGSSFSSAVTVDTTLSKGGEQSYDLIKEIVESRAELAQLIAKCCADNSGSESGTSKRKGQGDKQLFLCPIDRKSIPVAMEQLYPTTANNSKIEGGSVAEEKKENKEKADFKDIKEAKAKILAEIMHEKFNRTRYIRNKVKIPLKIKMPKSHKACPSLRAAESTISELIPYLTISHRDGYNFVNEFVYVYKGSFSKDSAYSTFLAVCQRAVIAVDPLMDETVAEQYAHYLLRRGIWEVDIGYDIAQGSMKDIFKTFDENLKVSKRCNINFYLSKVNDVLCVWYRICYDSDEVHMKRKNPNPALAGASFAYYRRYLLTRAHVDGFLNDIDSDKPPPPRPGLDDDYQLFLLWTFGRTDVYTLDDDVEIDFDDSIVNAGVASAAASTVHLDNVDARSRADKSDDMSNYGSNKKTLSITSSRKSNTKPLSLLQDCVSGNEIHSWGLETAPIASTLDMVTNSSQLVSSSRAVPLPLSFALDKVVSIACSSRHVVILTNLGLVYTMGENSEGALGLGDNLSREDPTLISSWPLSVKIVKVAASTSDLGSHTMAIDKDGMLYGWGLSYAVGLGKTTSTLSPALIDTFPKVKATAAGGGDNQDQDQDDDNLTIQVLKIKDVSCGNAFTVVIAETGEVFSWGMWSHGRLGLGKIPMIQNKRGGGFFNKGPSKLARYQLRPARVSAIKEAGSVVSCGDSHCLLLTVSGKVWAWGSNTSGQVGVGMESSGSLTDIITPKLLLFNTAAYSSGGGAMGGDGMSINNHSIYSETSNFADAVESAEMKLVKAGATHSLAIDALGKVWSWGGKGGACLGRGIPHPPKMWAGRLSTLFASSFSSGIMVIPFELLPWIRSWDTPQLVTTLNEVSSIAEISTGDSHTIFRTTLGEIYICGEGPVVPPVDIEDFEDSDADKVDELILSDKFAVKRPIQPSSKWLPDLFGRRIALVSGSAMRCYVVMSNESIADTFTGHLLENIMKRGSSSSSNSSSGAFQSSRGSVSSMTSSSRPDCVIVAGGGIFPAHRAVLACRSEVLRDMIVMESPSDYSTYMDMDEIDMNMIQLILPELNYDAAKALMYYLYTDDIPYSNSAQMSTLTSLLRASKKENLNLPRLKILVEQHMKVVRSITSQESSGDGQGIGGSGEDERRSLQVSLSTQSLPEPPPRTLTRDFSALIGNQDLFADVRFFAEGQPIYAHRLFLMERCTYFEAMFGSSIMENSNGSSAAAAIIDVVVPDDYKSFIRMLIYIYTHTIPAPGHSYDVAYDDSEEVDDPKVPVELLRFLNEARRKEKKFFVEGDEVERLLTVDGSSKWYPGKIARVVNNDTETLLNDIILADRYHLFDMRTLLESMIIPDENSWVDILEVSKMVRSGVLSNRVCDYLRDNSHILLKTHAIDVYDDEDEDEDDANNEEFDDEEKTQRIETGLQIIRQDYPDILTEILEARRLVQVAIPSDLLLDHVDPGRPEAKNPRKIESSSAQGGWVPIMWLVVLVISLYVYAKVASILSFGLAIPVINTAFIVGMLYLGYRKLFYK